MLEQAGIGWNRLKYAGKVCWRWLEIFANIVCCHFFPLLTFFFVPSFFFPYLSISSHLFQFLPVSSCFFPVLPVFSSILPYLPCFLCLLISYWLFLFNPFFMFLYMSSSLFLFFSRFFLFLTVFFLLFHPVSSRSLQFPPILSHFFPFLLQFIYSNLSGLHKSTACIIFFTFKKASIVCFCEWLTY